jgi:NADH-quinone oxidoreductase subunit G
VADEISGTSELCFVGRGDHTVIDIFPGKPINNELSLNTVEVCPVGALKNRDFLYTARVWNLDEMPGVCGLCAKGCAVRVDSLKGDVARVMARENPKVNDFWVCDQARLDFKWINSPRRIDRPRSPKGELTWDRAYDIAAEALKRAATNPGKAWVLAGAGATNEELWLLRKLAKDRLGIGNFAVMAEPDKAPLNFPKFKSPADANANRAGANIILGVANAEQSMKAFAEACANGNVEHVLVWSGLPHGVEKLTEVTRALAQEKVTNIVAVDFQASVLTELAHVSLASTTYVETGGSWINHESLLQAFRAALPYPRAGRIGTEILQELLFRVGETAVELPAAGSTPISGRDESYRGEVVQSGWSGSSTVPVFTGRGEVAVEARPRKVIHSPAAVFDELAAALPQLAGQSHLALIRAKGAKVG